MLASQVRIVIRVATSWRCAQTTRCESRHLAVHDARGRSGLCAGRWRAGLQAQLRELPHRGADSRAPAPDALRARTPQAIVESLMTGAMRPQGSRLSGPSGAPLPSSSPASRSRATSRARSGPLHRSGSVARSRSQATPRWTGWSPTVTNTRFQPADQAGLTRRDVPQAHAEVGVRISRRVGRRGRSRRWPAAASSSAARTARSTRSTRGPAASTGRSAPRGGVRTAIAIVGSAARRRRVVYFGDTAANAYALDAETGASAVGAQGRRPSARARSPDRRRCTTAGSTCRCRRTRKRRAPIRSTRCCTFRGSLSALDAATGAVIWKTYMITDPPQRRGTSTAGVPLWGPSGRASGRRRPIDVKRARASTSRPATPTAARRSRRATRSSRSISQTGAIRWMRQVTPDDVYVSELPRRAIRIARRPTVPTSTSAARRCYARAGGRDVIVIGQKSGIGYAHRPREERRRCMWQYRAGRAACSAASSGERRSMASTRTSPCPTSRAAARRPARGHAGDRRARVVRAAAAADVRQRPRLQRARSRRR